MTCVVRFKMPYLFCSELLQNKSVGIYKTGMRCLSKLYNEDILVINVIFLKAYYLLLIVQIYIHISIIYHLYLIIDQEMFGS